MARYDNMQLVSLEAGQDLSAKQFFFVSVSADGQIDPTGDGAHADGVLQNDPDAAGKAASVCVGGITKVECGGTVTRGGPVSSDANGAAVDSTTGDVIIGTALETGANGSIIAIIFQPRAAFA